MFQVDAHLTRDFTEHFWGSLDAAWYYGGQASINGVSGEKLNNLGFGLTLGYYINDNLNLTSATSRPLTTALPGTFAWMVSWFRSWWGGTRSSKARKG